MKKTTKELYDLWRERQKMGGYFKEMKLYAHPDDKPAIRAYVLKLRKQRLKIKEKLPEIKND